MNEVTGTEPAAIRIRNLRVGYEATGQASKTWVLDGLSLDVAQGEFVCLLGESGCGKTTLLNVLAGFQTPNRGEVWIGGEPVRGPDPRRIMIFQQGSVFPWLTVAENVRFGLGSRSREDSDAAIARELALVGLSGSEHAYPHQLSGGMLQRVEIARAFAADPELILMDEPFSALDHFTRQKMRDDLIKIWQAHQKTIVFVTHDLDEAIQLADRVVVLGGLPARIKCILTINEPRPRDPESTANRANRRELLDSLKNPPN